MFKSFKNRFLSLGIVTALAATILMSAGILTQAQDNDYSSDATFETDGGVYSYEYILEKYNAFSFDDLLVGVGHINGPIIAKGDVSKVNGLNVDGAEVSYVKTTSPFAVMDSTPYFDLPAPPIHVQGKAYIYGVQAPLNAYFGSVNTISRKLFWGDIYQVFLNDLTNSLGDGETNVVPFLQDDYVDWDRALTVLKEESQQLLNGQGNILDELTGDNYVVVKEGENVVITSELYNNPNFEYILFLSENGDNNTGPYDSKKTIITYDVQGSVFMKEVKWAEKETDNHEALSNLAGYFPGGPETDNPNGPGFDKNAKSINLIHHYPNDNIILNKNLHKRFGQLFAPTSEYYDAAGDINGNSIVKKFVVNSEAHMWPMKAPVETKVSFTVNKLWKGILNDDQKVDVSVQLYKNGVAYGEPVTLTSPSYTYTWGDLDAKDANGASYVYTVDEINVPDGFISTVKGGTITNTYVSPKTSISGTKTWVGGPTVKPTITIELYRDDVLFDSVDLLDGVTAYLFDELDKTDENGVEYVYTVKEVDVDNYTTTQVGYDLTNTYVSPKTSISGTKTWVGGPAVKPTITIELYRDDVLFDSVDLLDGVTAYLFDELDKTDENGVEYVYTVKEVEVKDFETSYNGYDILNKFIGDLVRSFNVTKIWAGGPAKKPAITIVLMQNGVDYDSITIDKAPWSHEFINLPIFDTEGKEYIYSIKELDVPDYESSITGGSIRNTYIGETTTEFTVNKVWVNAPVDKPAITIYLMQNDNLFDTVVLDGELSYTWDDLPKFDANGVVYKYSVLEGNVPFYESNVDGNTITNTFIEEEVELFSISGYKKDRLTDVNLEGARIELWREGDSTSYRVAYTDMNGYFEFRNLEKGKYTLKETVAPIGYELDAPDVEVIIEGSDVENVIFKNTKIDEPVEELFSISGYKKDRKSGEYLQGARIELWREGDSTSYRVAYTDKNGFFKFDGLEKGKYIVKETVPPVGYKLDSPDIDVVLDNSDVEDVIFRNTKLDPEKPIKPEEPDKPNRPWEEVPEKPTCDKDMDYKCPSNGGVLPNTGFGMSSSLYSIGMIAVGSLLVALGKKKESEEE